MKLISWNVNGIRAVIKYGFLEFLSNHDPDIICLQETRANSDQIELNLLQYHQYWNPAEKKGYSGTVIFTKIKPIQVINGIGIKKHDHEGRVITLEFQDYFLINVYTPNAQRKLLRLNYRIKEWDVNFLAYLKKLERKKPVIFCGDLNVAHKEIDLANPKTNKNNAGFTKEERTGFDSLINAGFIDTFREFEKEGGHYTWWSNFSNARQRNIGWRIDYFCISSSLQNRLIKSYILSEVKGSDHCPIVVVLE